VETLSKGLCRGIAYSLFSQLHTREKFDGNSKALVEKNLRCDINFIHLRARVRAKKVIGGGEGKE